MRMTSVHGLNCRERDLLEGNATGGAAPQHYSTEAP